MAQPGTASGRCSGEVAYAILKFACEKETSNPPGQASSAQSLLVGPNFVAVAGEEALAAWRLEDGRQLLK